MPPAKPRPFLFLLFKRALAALSPPAHLALFRRIPLAPVALALLAGIQLGYSLPGLVWIGLVVLVGGLVLSRRWDVGILVALLGLGWTIAPHYDGDSRDLAPLPNQPDLYMAVVRDVELRPETEMVTMELTGGITDSLGTVNGIWRRKRDPQRSAAQEVHILPGDTLLLNCTLTRPPPARNPHGFDYRYYLWTRNIDVQVTKPVQIVAYHPREGWHLGRATTLTRRVIKQRLVEWLGSPQSDLMAGLLLGDKTNLDRETREQFQRSGVAHLLAVSGLHVGYIVLMLLALATMLRLSGWGRLILIIPFLMGYVLITGGPPSVVRAGIMAALYLWGRALQRQPAPWNLLAAAAIISVLIDPRSQFTPGFQLSFSAVAGILYLLPRLQTSLKLTRAGAWLYGNGIWRFIIDLALVSISAQLGTLPVQTLYFHVLPVWGLPANLLVVPLAGMAVATGALALVLVPLTGWIGMVFTQTAWLATSLIHWLVAQFSTLPPGVIVTGRPGWALLSGMVVVLLGLPWLFTGERRRRWFYLLGGGLLLANLALWPRLFSKHELRVTVLDVGQGDAIHLSLPGGEQLMVDFGPVTPRFDAGARVVAPYLRGQGITRLTSAIMTHPHNDHAGGLPALLERIEIQTLWDTPHNIRNRVYARVQGLADSLGVPRRIMLAGEVAAFGEVDLLVLAPDSLPAANPGKENNASLVLLVRYGQTAFLLMGDTERESEWRLMAYGPVLAADWIKVGHHGAATGTSRQFLEAVKPRGAVISVGSRNRFGHPAAKTLTRLGAVVDSVHRTDLQGALVLVSNGEEWRTVDWR